MWSTFFAASALCLLFTAVPGFLFLRIFDVPRLPALVGSGAFTLLIIELACVVFPRLGITATWYTVFGIPTIVLAIAFLSAFILRRHHSKLRSSFSFETGFSSSREEWTWLGIYVGIGICFAGYIFVRNLDGPDCFFQAYDNVFHLSTIQSFIQSGVWSPLSVTSYVGDAASYNPLPGASYYPAAFHALCALLVSALGISTACSINVVLFVYMAVVFPANCYLVFSIIFKNTPNIVRTGCILPLAFTGFPWGFATWGPLYSNLISYAVMPSVIAFFIYALRQTSLMKAIALFAISLIAIASFAFTQPNGAFTTGIALTPYLCYRAYCIILSKTGSRPASLLGCVAVLIAIVLAWAAMYNASFMQAALAQLYPAYYSNTQAVTNILTLALRESSASLPLMLLMALGTIYCIRSKRTILLLLPFLFACIMYFADATLSETSFIKSVLTGFWYCDIFRIAAIVSIFALPIAAMGLHALCQTSKRVFELLDPRKGYSGTIVNVAVVGLALIAILYPNHQITGIANIDTGMGTVASNVKQRYSTTEQAIIDPNESAFLRTVKEYVDPDDVIINVPDDGSAFAYGSDGLNIYYRYLRTYDVESETENSKVIREHLCDIASDPSVQEAVKETGGRYVLLLDTEALESKTLFTWWQNQFLWDGVLAINDLTPGFTPVLKSGSMALYEIDQ